MQTSKYCAGLRSFSNLSEKAFLFYFIFGIPAGIWTTLPTLLKKNLKLDSLFNWEPMGREDGSHVSSTASPCQYCSLAEFGTNIK